MGARVAAEPAVVRPRTRGARLLWDPGAAPLTSAPVGLRCNPCVKQTNKRKGVCVADGAGERKI